MRWFEQKRVTKELRFGSCLITALCFPSIMYSLIIFFRATIKTKLQTLERLSGYYRPRMMSLLDQCPLNK